MLRKTILATTVMSLLLAAADVQSQEITPQPNDASDAGSQAAEYRALLSQDPEKLAELGRERGVKLLAELRYGRAIARGEARERNLERQRVELMTRADELEKQNDVLRIQVEAEMQEIRQQFADDPDECDRQLLALVNKHRPRALELRAEAQRCKDLADQTGGHLAEVRRELVTLVQDRDLLAQGDRFRRTETPAHLVQAGNVLGDGTNSFGLDGQSWSELNLDPKALGLVGLGADDGAERAGSTGPVSREQVQQAVDEFNSLLR